MLLFSISIFINTLTYICEHNCPHLINGEAEFGILAFRHSQKANKKTERELMNTGATASMNPRCKKTCMSKKTMTSFSCILSFKSILYCRCPKTLIQTN
jgi:hypothetical protein